RDSGERFERILSTGREVTLDMEGSDRTDVTLRLFRDHSRHGLGIALQAYLRRTPSDLAALRGCLGKVRLTKGAYAEPPDIALAGKADVDAAFDRLTTALFHTDGLTPAIATHDPLRLQWARATAAGLHRDAA